MNFLALDFETANYYCDSACALGLVRVEDNEINVLSTCCERHKIIKPEVDFRCTMKLSRKVFGLYPTNLPAVCRNFNIDL
jgi:DNA polymerase III epsilon subunit-like protein